MLKFNPILAVDSYKMSHAFAYPDDVTGMHSYIEARTGGKDIMIPFGLQMWMMKFLSVPVTKEHIDEAEAFAKVHGEPFKREAWEYMVSDYGGYFPVTIRAVPEGTPVRSGNAIVTVECTDPKLFWVVSYLETALLRAVWNPTTIATLDYAVKKDIEHFYRVSGADMSLVPFSLHDFGGRGVSSAETAEISGAAHLVNFMGSDTIEGVRAANYYYDEPMSAFSVPATEHSVECAFGLNEDEELKYLEHTIKSLATPGGIVSIVIDAKDVYRAAKTLCTKLHDLILSSKAKIVFRPDSGDMMEVVPRLLEMQDLYFGSVINDKGYKKINSVGIIQGDGVDRLAIRSLLGKILAMGYSADNVVFGSGGALLQMVNRDVFKFAMKASAVKKGGAWVAISKDPITDPGKKSKAGRLTLVKSKMTGEYITVPIHGYNLSEYVDVMQLVYDCGVIVNKSTLAQIRERCAT